MRADNVVLLFILVWTSMFFAVCQKIDDDVIVSCDNVTGSVGKEVTFNCRVSLQDTECCIKIYKFKCPEIYNDSAICQEFPVNPCEQRNNFTCSYTPTSATKEKVRFFVKTKCGAKQTEFTVNIAEFITFDIVTEAPGKKGAGTRNYVLSTVSGVILSILLSISIILIAVSCVKFKSANSSGLQRKYERAISEA